MSAPRDLHRDVRACFEEEAVGRAPEGLLDAAMSGVAATRQRPSLLVTDRWMPRRLVRGARLGPRAFVVAMVVLLLIALASALVLTGSSRRPAPPFGLAKPGLIALAGGDVYGFKLDGSPPTPIVSGPGPEDNAVYSPDGLRIAFETVQPDLSITLFVMPAGGGQATPLIEGLALSSSIAWSPDSRQVAVANLSVQQRDPTGNDPTFNRRILLARLGQPGTLMLGGGEVHGADPAWSPDGSRIAFTRNWPCCNDQPEAIWLADADGSNLHPLSPQLPTTPIAGSWTSGAGQAAWSPDGARIGFLAVASGGLNQVFVVRVAGGEPVDVSHSRDDVLGFSWSPDGSRLAYTRMLPPHPHGYDSGIVVINVDGTHPVTLNGPVVSGDAPIWSPDGKRLLGLAWSSQDAVEGNGSGKDEIVAFDPSNRAPPITTSVPRFNTASWQRLAP